jgi:hypothetical protein
MCDHLKDGVRDSETGRHIRHRIVDVYVSEYRRQYRYEYAEFNARLYSSSQCAANLDEQEGKDKRKNQVGNNVGGNYGSQYAGMGDSNLRELFSHNLRVEYAVECIRTIPTATAAPTKRPVFIFSSLCNASPPQDEAWAFERDPGYALFKKKDTIWDWPWWLIVN